ncbi:hypothetical protein POL68_33340 [Stigmatella sp. ncwal1]|uniref:Uncharacterized protein n=1 Tax=Stigmatella ashevillensis TaxID=2995309 RepID=A0ABT5DIB4_9BACT|nr:hypothetical protein [Stigmatella ashevillena]MDC0713396.1 hypothetical protein [Stigmatella ashevillena]
MDPLEKALKGLEARTLEELLTRLAELQSLRARGEPVRLPQVTLHLRSGRELQGFLLELRGESPGGKAVVLHAMSAHTRRSEPDAIFVRPEAIEAITVHDLPSLGQPARDLPPPPNKLELRRKLAQRRDSLAAALGTPLELEVDWDRLPPEPDALEALDVLGTRAFGVLEGLTRELLGLEALRTHVRKLHLAVGSAAQVLRQQESLRLITPVGAVGRMTQEELRGAIEKVL